MRKPSKLIGLFLGLCVPCLLSGLAPPAAATGPSVSFGGTTNYVRQQPARDPVLEGVRIEVSSREPAHRAERVGVAANRGLSSMSFPRPMPLFAPPARHVRTLVGIDTWFWVPAVQWRPIVRVVAAGGVVVTLIATPVTLQLLPGDGTPLVSCSGPGRPWLMPGSRSLCSHVYQRASTARATGRYRAVVQSVWTVRWTSSTGLSGVVGPIVVPTPVSLRVAEAQAVLRR